MEAAKKADRTFGLTPRSTKHTIADASSRDICKITTQLLKQKATTKMNRSLPFCDSIVEGFKKMTPTWLKLVLAQDSESLLDQDSHVLQDTEQPDFMYELYDVL